MLEVANRHLAAHGFEALSLTAVAHEAGTTRQALYRRWPSKSSLAADAIRLGAEDNRRTDSDDPLHDLELELADFQRIMTRPGAVSLVGTMLQQSTDDTSLACYRDHVVAPRRARILAILERALERGLIDADADLEAATSLPTGSWYARELAGAPASRDWPARTAALVWRAVGGQQRKGKGQ